MSVYAIASNIISPLGDSVAAHWQAVQEGRIGIQQHDGTYYGSKLTQEQLTDIQPWFDSKEDITPFEQLCITSARKALADVAEFDLKSALLVLSTTKGNIEGLDVASDERLSLHRSAEVVAGALGIEGKPMVVSHACISGSVALMYAQRLLDNDRYKHAVVIGCDRFTDFVLKGFQSFQAIADGPCKPFDAKRTGINLGEAAATIILTTEKPERYSGVLLGGATSNDANHISGPSRTGDELADAISRAMQQANVHAGDIGMVSAHGTATAYNDEMEAKALNTSGLAGVPVHSFKGYTGHTLGAAGVLESAMLLEAMKQQQLIPSPGYSEHGVPVPLNVTKEMRPATINYVLKTASGFGGCNAAIVWGRN